jgi:glycosyltransferase involved in cell wall biosynthesis
MDRLSDLLASADAHLVSLRREALGYVVPSKIYGVMAAGRPAVFVGPPDSEAAGMIRDSGGGFVASIGRGDAVADALRRLREDPWQAARMGAAARDYYASLLGRDRSVRRIIDVLVGGGNPP